MNGPDAVHQDIKSAAQMQREAPAENVDVEHPEEDQEAEMQFQGEAQVASPREDAASVNYASTGLKYLAVNEDAFEQAAEDNKKLKAMLKQSGKQGAAFIDDDDEISYDRLMRYIE